MLAYCVNAYLNFCNVGSKPTLRTKTREEVLDLTLVNLCAWNRVVGWHVSNVPSFSDHINIRFHVKSRIQKQAKMFHNVRRTCWNKYVNELEQKLNEQTLRPVPCLPQKKTLMCWQTRFVQLLLTHAKLLALCESRFVRKITFSGILS